MREDLPLYHGTAVASMAVGDALGVAKDSKFIGVKFRSNATTVPRDLARSWNWVLDDVRGKGRNGRAVIVLSYSKPSLSIWIYQYSALVDIFQASSTPSTSIVTVTGTIVA